LEIIWCRRSYPECWEQNLSFGGLPDSDGL
jgi:hypothetical protein